MIVKSIFILPTKESCGFCALQEVDVFIKISFIWNLLGVNMIFKIETHMYEQ